MHQCASSEGPVAPSSSKTLDIEWNHKSHNGMCAKNDTQAVDPSRPQHKGSFNEPECHMAKCSKVDVRQQSTITLDDNSLNKF